MILSCLGVLVSDRQTDERTLVVVESLSRLKKLNPSIIHINTIIDLNSSKTTLTKTTKINFFLYIFNRF